MASFEFGTRIYAPEAGDNRFRILSPDPGTGKRKQTRARTEAEARYVARELERKLLAVGARRADTGFADRTIANLADRYVSGHLNNNSRLYRERQDVTLRRWVLPHIGHLHILDWTAADSEQVLAAARGAGLAPATVQTVGAAMRGLVTHARRLRWLTSLSEDPMWMVRYSKPATIQGEHGVYIPRATLPTDEQCEALFAAMEAQDETMWALAMRLTYRSGVRFGELTALQVRDIQFTPRVVHVRRAVERPARGELTLKLPKNGRTRTTIFPRSIEDALRRYVDQMREQAGNDALLFPGPDGKIMRRSALQRPWIKAAEAAGWEFKRARQRSAPSAKPGQGWRWTGAAQWSPHDLRHVAACWMLFDLKLDAAVVAAKLGHADPSFTVKRYVGVRGDPDTGAMDITEDW